MHQRRIIAPTLTGLTRIAPEFLADRTQTGRIAVVWQRAEIHRRGKKPINDRYDQLRRIWQLMPEPMQRALYARAIGRKQREIHYLQARRNCVRNLPDDIRNRCHTPQHISDIIEEDFRALAKMTEARIASRFIVKVFHCANGGNFEVEANSAVTKIIRVPGAGLGKNAIQAMIDLRMLKSRKSVPERTIVFPIRPIISLGVASNFGGSESSTTLY